MSGHARRYNELRDQVADDDNSKRQRVDESTEYIILKGGGTFEAKRKINYLIENGDTRLLSLR
jgi:hypothetical protein